MISESVALLGYGRFGRALGQLLAEAGIAHRAYDEHAEVPREFRATSPGDLVKGAAFVIVAVPVPRMRSALLDLRPHLQASQIVVDVGSLHAGLHLNMLGAFNKFLQVNAPVAKTVLGFGGRIAKGGR